jgi:hypothetical protein
MHSDVKLLWFIPVNSRSRRRGVVLSFYASMVLGCMFSLLIHSPSGAPLLMGLYAGMVASFVVLGASYLALVHLLGEYGLVGRHAMHTSRDERLEQVRHAAYVRAYWILMTLVCATSAIFLSGTTEGVLRATVGFAGKPLVPVAAIVMAVSLPSVVIAWTEPDPQEAA